MSKLINELKAEHSLLIDSFNNIKHLNVASKEASEQLKSVKSVLLGHIRKENDEIYSKLREKAFNNLRLQRTLDLFTRDVARLSAVIIQFLDKYSEGGSDLAFRRDSNRLSIILGAHIRREEEVIFSEYLGVPVGRVA